MPALKLTFGKSGKILLLILQEEIDLAARINEGPPESGGPRYLERLPGLTETFERDERAMFHLLS
jgi:hypothetical protein